MNQYFLMLQYFLNLRIRIKLLIAFGSILLLSVTLLVLSITAIKSVMSYQEIVKLIDNAALQITRMNSRATEFHTVGFKNEGFHLTGTSPVIQAYDAQYLHIQNSINKLQKYPEHLKNQSPFLMEIETATENYNAVFQDLITIFKERGFKDYGVEGQLREAIHSVESSNFPFDKVQMLMLRRHEKDFFLRKDLKYQEKFNELLESFKQEIATSDQDPVATERITNLLADYSERFNHVVSLETKIGLDEEKGMIGSLATIYGGLIPQIDHLVTSVRHQVNNEMNKAYIKLIILFIIQLGIGAVLVIFYSSLLTKSIKEIKSAMVALSSGRYPEKLKLYSKDELGQTKEALNQLVLRIKTAADFAIGLGDGNLQAKYDKNFSDDVLAKSIQGLQEQLIKAEEKQKVIFWTNKGLALFSDIFRNEATDLKVLSDDLIKLLVKYVGLNQGALYISMEEDNRVVLNRVATYAYDRKRYVEDKVEPGQGLVGQAVLEKEHIYLTNVPSGFTKITSGMGEATPSMVLIVPLLVRDEVKGVVELAGFHKLMPYQIDFILKIAESIANIISNKQQSEKTNNLLTESRFKAEQLSFQEEELLQNAEELKATQEEMQRQRLELEQEIKYLKSLMAETM